MSQDVMEQMRSAFRAEALDLLIELDSALLSLEAAPGDMSFVHRVFRAIHTIKGSGGTAGFRRLAQFVHKIEEAFDLAREGRLAVTPELIDCGLKACDVILTMVEDREAANVSGEAEVTEAVARLLPDNGGAYTGPRKGKNFQSDKLTAYRIIFKPASDIFYYGTEPVTILDELRKIGQVHLTAHVDRVPSFNSLEPENCYLWWEILLVIPERERAAIEKAFEFVEGLCELRIQPVADQAGTLALVGSIPSETLDLFALECAEHLEQLEDDARRLEKNPSARNVLDSVFRGVHSIKGNAGLLLGQLKSGALHSSHPLQLIARVTHSLESLLDTFREPASGPVTTQVIQTLLQTIDAVYSLTDSLSNQHNDHGVSAEVLERLGVELEDEGDGSSSVSLAAFLNTTTQCLEMMSSCLQMLEDPDQASGPAIEAYLRGLKTLSTAAEYRKQDELTKTLSEQLQLLDAAMRAGGAIGELERASLGTSYQKVVEIVDQITVRSAGEQQTDANLEAVKKTESAAPEIKPGASAAASTIRIEQEKLDRLMRGVGELLVARGAFPLLVQKLSNGAAGAVMAKDLKEAGANVSRIADELQASLMSIRMLPIKTVFQRFPRLVRDLARSLGKEVHLTIEGDSIELDKTILEQIGDPLVHIIRNAVDHGLETPDNRQASGKDATGNVTLRALHEAGRVIIEIADDGKGLDARALKRKAAEKGLITTEAAAAMSDEAAFQLIFLPGLSTAAKVTDVSGRGVGMDVVRSNVRNLQGTIDIRSKLGQGTTFTVKLPTSLMISKGILMEAGGCEYILPLSNIQDMVKMPLAEVREYRGQQLAQIRGNLYSVFTLAHLLGLKPPDTPLLSIAIVEASGLRYGLVVDRFVTEVEVLVKPLSGGLADCKEFQGAAIMGDGRVVLVLNAMECHGISMAAVG